MSRAKTRRERSVMAETMTAMAASMKGSFGPVVMARANVKLDARPARAVNGRPVMVLSVQPKRSVITGIMIVTGSLMRATRPFELVASNRHSISRAVCPIQSVAMKRVLS